MGNSSGLIADSKRIPTLEGIRTAWFKLLGHHSNYLSERLLYNLWVYCQCQLSTVLCFAVDLLTRAAEMFLGLKE